jgi:hypothetical protein
LGVATVNYSTGLVTPVAAGTAHIKYCFNGVCSSGAGTNLTVNNTPTLNSITLSPSTWTMLIGATKAYDDGVTYPQCNWSDSTHTYCPGGTWSSSSGTVASITTGGLATGLSVGSTTIGYTYLSVAATGVTLNITAPSYFPAH